MPTVEKVRSTPGTPVLADFDSGLGTPIVIDSVAGVAYVLTDAGVITPLLGLPGLLPDPVNAGDVVQVNAAGTAYEFSEWVRVTSSQAVAQGQNYILAGSSMTLTLPATAVKGMPVRFLTETAALTGNVVARNGKTIMALSEDMTIDDNKHWFWEMVYDDTTGDWRIS